MTNKTILIYTGDGSRFLLGVPLRDLTEKDTGGYTVKQLVDSGLYKKPKTKAVK